VVWSDTPISVVGEVTGVTNGKPEVMSAPTAAGIEIELLAAVAVAVGYNARGRELRAAVNPRFHRKRCIIGERAEINSLDVADVTVDRRKLADSDGEIRVVGIVAGQAEIDVEVLAVMTTPGIVGDGAVCFVQSPIGNGIVRNNSLRVADGGTGQD